MENQKKILELALYAGEIMLKNGGETYRSEDVMKRICKVCGIEKVESFVTPTGMFLAIDDGNAEGNTYNFQKSITERDINLAKVARINDFSRKFHPENQTLEDAMNTLKEIDSMRSYPLLIKGVFSGIATSAFTVAGGGQLRDCVCAFFIGFIMLVFIDRYSMIEKNYFIRTLMASAIGAVLAILFYRVGFCDSVDYILIGAIYILLPGIAITNAIRDSLSGDLLSGLVRVFEAFLISGSIAVGVGLVLNIFNMGGGVM